MSKDSSYVDNSKASERAQKKLKEIGLEDAQKLLEFWELSELKDVFKEHEISVRALKYISYKEMCELIPKIGPRTIFHAMLREWRCEQDFSIKISPTTATIIHSPADSNDSLIKAKEKVDTPIIKTEFINDGCEESIATFTDDDENFNDDNHSLLDPIDEMEQDSAHNEEKIQIDETNEKLEMLRTSSRTIKLTQKCINGNIFWQKNALRMPKKCRPLNYKPWNGEQLYVKDLLEASPEGQNALCFYKEQNCLDSRIRKDVVLVLVQAVLERRVKRYVAVFEYMSRQLAELFPNESAKTYFVAPNASNDSRVRGAFIHKYSNYTRLLRKFGLWNKDVMKEKMY